MSAVVPGATGETWDRLAGDWRIWQLAGGHRWSVDDLLTAWTAAEARPQARTLLDLGAGLGSVGLLTLWRMQPEARLTMLEVQTVSHDLAKRTIVDNALGGRVDARLGDLREDSTLGDGARFDLVTGSPPYFPLGTGKVSPHPQRAAARMELRGTITDYAARAARHLAPGGAFVACFPAADPRGEASFASARMHLRARRLVYFRSDQPALLALFVATAEPGERADLPPFYVRGEDGRWTDEYLAMRAAMGNPIERRAAPSVEGAGG